MTYIVPSACEDKCQRYRFYKIINSKQGVIEELVKILEGLDDEIDDILLDYEIKRDRLYGVNLSIRDAIDKYREKYQIGLDKP